MKSNKKKWVMPVLMIIAHVNTYGGSDPGAEGSGFILS
jgi:hypothetical protein